MADENRPSLVDRRPVLQAVGGLLGAGVLGSTDAVAATTSGVEDTQSMSYELPELPYGYDALEPHIDKEIMELHHGEHHQAYVDGANEALDEFEKMREDGTFDDIRAAKRDYSFNLSGHVNHTIFWENMSPDGGGEPADDSELMNTIADEFGSFEDFRDEFSAAAEEVEGDGWAMVLYEPFADRLVIGQMEAQNGLANQLSVPILALDVWEHAYYLQYPNDRAAYIDEWWNVVDWGRVEQWYELVTGQVSELRQLPDLTSLEG